MSDDMRTKGELAAATLLDVITVLKLGLVQQEQANRTSAQMQETLVKILEGQTRLEKQVELGVERGNEHEKEIRDSRGKIKLLESRTNDHAARIKRLETEGPDGAGRASRAG